MATEGKNRGQNWSIHEIQALVSLWSEEGLQRELKKSVRNDLAYASMEHVCSITWSVCCLLLLDIPSFHMASSRELAKRGYIHTVEQCRAKMKSLKTKYKQIVD